jgi:hypothetical protein
VNITNITHNITCVLSEHHEIHLRTSHVYHMNIKKIRLEHHIYTMRSSQNITHNITGILCHITSHIYYMNIACILYEYHKIHNRTSYVYYVNITCISCKHHKMYHRTLHLCYVNISKYTSEHHIYAM